MTTRTTRVAALSLPVLLLPAAILWSSVRAAANEQENSGAPIVKITAPRDKSSYSWNAMVNYSIVASYQGKSTEYQELSSRDVLLKTTYVSDLSTIAASTIAAKPAFAAGSTPAGLLQITRSTCLGCHSFKAKAMGPSFAAVGQRYPENQASMETLSQHIRQGSTGAWGQEHMPAQTELSDDQVHSIVLWILHGAADPSVNYYVGTEGSFRMEAGGTADARGGMLLTASYTSAAQGADAEHAAYGEDTVIVQGK